MACLNRFTPKIPLFGSKSPFFRQSYDVFSDFYAANIIGPLLCHCEDT